MFIPFKRPPLLLFVWPLFLAKGVKALEFDPALLQQNGLGAAVADYFSQSAKFTPGMHQVKVTLNGSRLPDYVSVLFDSHGQVCFTNSLLHDLGLQLPKEAKSDPHDQCLAFVHDYPPTQLTLDPAEQQVDLLVPTAALVQAPSAMNFSQGGNALLLNYLVNANQNQQSGMAAQKTMYAFTTLGFNSGDWLFRSSQSYTHDSDNGKQFTQFNSYVQRTFDRLGATLQAGQIDIQNSVMQGVPLTGAQWFPEQALYARTNVTITGIARSSARVGLFQNGVLKYSMVVPAGAFKIDNPPNVDPTRDVEVSVTEQDGTTHQFLASASNWGGNLGQQSLGMSVAFGRYHNQSDTAANVANASPTLLSINDGWSLGQHGQLKAGGIVSSPYQGLGIGLSRPLGQYGMVSLNTYLSHAKLVDDKGERHSESGVQSLFSYNDSVSQHLSFNVGTSFYTRGYHEFIDVTQPAAEVLNYKWQYNGGVSYSTDHFGYYTLNYNSYYSFNGTHSAGMLFNWNKQLGKGTLTVNLQKDLTTPAMRNDRFNTTPPGALQLFISYTLPLGKSSSLTTMLTRNNGDEQLNTSFNSTINDTTGYTLSVGHDMQQGGSDNFVADINTTTHYTQLSLGTTLSQGSTAWRGNAQGGVVLHDGSVLFTPNPVQDTFAVVDIPGRSGVRLDTPAGTVWTDYRGRAVVSQLMPYTDNALKVDSNSLSRHVQINHSYQTVRPSRGAVQDVSFAAHQVRHVIVHLQRNDGQPLPTGISVTDQSGELINGVTDGSLVYIDNAQSGQPLFVHLSQNQVCRFQLQLSALKRDTPAIETIAAICTDQPGSQAAAGPQPEVQNSEAPLFH